IWSLDIATGKETPIPFTADVDQMIGELVRFTYPVNDSVLTVRQIRGARPSPDGKRLVFSALDRLWTMDLPAGTPRRVTTSTDGEHAPVWSPDGKVHRVCLLDGGRGDIWRVPADGGQPSEAHHAVGVLRQHHVFADRFAYCGQSRPARSARF
ncbi:MAG: PD40 domain-containing protein, partial [Gemmatimonadetes bacterium]|nr:PD40 domain-containing protein [Gemmatimonadota bacterium]